MFGYIIIEYFVGFKLSKISIKNHKIDDKYNIIKE